MEMRIAKEVAIPVKSITLKGELAVPLNATAIIVFSHGSGSSRFSSRNQMVAAYLRERNFGTLLFDLLTNQEDEDYDNRFNIDLLSSRLIGVTEWLNANPATKDLSVGYFGASTGAASALQAAANMGSVGAVVSRGGRPDLAMRFVERVEAPTLLIVGGLDSVVLELNQRVLQRLHCPKDLIIVEGATHLFEEPGKLDKVATLAAEWFEKYLSPVAAVRS
jgi:putative phosphoribosyl transferase